MPRFLRPLWILYGLILSALAIFSYSLTAPNLILSSWEPYWDFQTWMWKHFYNQRHDLTTVYLILILVLFAVYGLMIYFSRNWKLSSASALQKLLPWWLGLLLPLLVGYNALSYDIFNYIFNARIIVLYEASPYQKVALDFAYDPWTRFMHNIHTPAPYGWGWTGFSILAYLAGLGKFLLTWLIFKTLGTVSLILLWLTGNQALKGKDSIKVAPWLLLFLNPLLLLEFGLVAHNDLWMMLPAVISLLLVKIKPSKRIWLTLVLSLLLLGLSISVKLATLLLLPVWVLLVSTWFISWPKLKHFISTYWPVLASLAMLSLLTHARSQYFHPWYLSWALVWLPFFPDFGGRTRLSLFSNLVKMILISLSFTSLLRYIPWLLTGEYPLIVIYQQRVITWSGILLAVAIFLIWQLKQTWLSSHSKNR